MNKCGKPCKCDKPCNCTNQIVWFFDKPTVIICEECEIALHHANKKCPKCGGKVTYFTKVCLRQ